MHTKWLARSNAALVVFPGTDGLADWFRTNLDADLVDVPGAPPGAPPGGQVHRYARCHSVQGFRVREGDKKLPTSVDTLSHHVPDPSCNDMPVAPSASVHEHQLRKCPPQSERV